MKIIRASYKIEDYLDGPKILKKLEKAIRTCYKSEDKISDDDSSARTIIKHILSNNHESTLEHFSFTVRFVVDRGISHELVRHRLASFSQESTRYCNYAGDKFGREITFIKPPWIHDNNIMTQSEVDWFSAMRDSEVAYFNLIDCGWKPQQARSVLPNSLKTEIVISANLREWRFDIDTALLKGCTPTGQRGLCTTPPGVAKKSTFNFR